MQMVGEPLAQPVWKLRAVSKKRAYRASIKNSHLVLSVRLRTFRHVGQSVSLHLQPPTMIHSNTKPPQSEEARCKAAFRRRKMELEMGLEPTTC